LFVAAVIPAVIAVAAYMITVAIWVRRDPSSGPPGERLTWGERFSVLRESWGAVALLLSVIGGLYGGIFTVYEAAALGTGLAFAFTVVRGRLNRQSLRQVTKETAANTGLIYLIVAGASIFSSFIAVSKMPEVLVAMITELALPSLAVIFVLMVVFLILGSIFDTLAAIVITMPFVLPLVVGMGYHPVWWGIVMVMMVEVGMITPPIGLNVFVLFGVAENIPLNTIFRGILPFFFADMIRISIIILFPALSLWLPGLAGLL
jgi:tripartite ATP-independent transporter DctM subunit